jgi:hypothetical protein
VLVTGILFAGCTKKPGAFASLKDADTARQLKQFVTEKEAQANATTNALPRDFRAFFAAAEGDDWLAVTNSFAKLAEARSWSPAAGPRSPLLRSLRDFLANLMGKIGSHSSPLPNRVRGAAWEAVKEVFGAFEQFHAGDEKYSGAFGRDIIKSIPSGSIYFGGTDPGRFIVTAMSKSQIQADPFFTLTQNALADGSYLDYLRAMYGSKISIPTAADSQKAFEDYTADASSRQAAGKLKPGEDVRTSGGRVQVSGQNAVMQINGLLVRDIFENNSNREFFVEESFPLDWMYPQLEPHGLIFKLDRRPLTKLSDDIVQNDHEYWAKYVQPMIGGWLNETTPVAEIASFAEKTFARHDFSGFAGDPRFIQNAYAHKMYSKLRSSIGGLYRWRLDHAADAADKERMAREADFAFRQAWALCPYSPEVVVRYANFLLKQERVADAVKVAEAAAAMPQTISFDNGQFAELAKQLRQWQGQNPPTNSQ